MVFLGAARYYLALVVGRAENRWGDGKRGRLCYAPRRRLASRSRCTVGGMMIGMWPGSAGRLPGSQICTYDTTVHGPSRYRQGTGRVEILHPTLLLSTYSTYAVRSYYNSALMISTVGGGEGGGSGRCILDSWDSNSSRNVMGRGRHSWVGLGWS
ncbi:hypothetical protein K440DRAFT_191163 [Wilcoxina mikolae CBS 423.85]|nr:hypothetical protein K440DRAFT_191163 [Wilcoxina mikolae CBS 423.85]